MKEKVKKVILALIIIFMIWAFFITCYLIGTYVGRESYYDRNKPDNYKYCAIDDTCTSINAYRVVMYYNNLEDQSKCIFTEKEAEKDDSVMIYEDEGYSPGTMIGIYDLVNKEINTETTYEREGIYLGKYESYTKSKTVWIQFLKSKG